MVTNQIVSASFRMKSHRNQIKWAHCQHMTRRQQARIVQAVKQITAGPKSNGLRHLEQYEGKLSRPVPRRGVLKDLQ